MTYKVRCCQDIYLYFMFLCLINMPHIKQLLADISSYQTFVLFGHQSPDGDAIGSILALRKILLDQGKTVSCYTPDPPSEIFSFLPDIVYIGSDFDYAPYDCMIFWTVQHMIVSHHLHKATRHILTKHTKLSSIIILLQTLVDNSILSMRPPVAIVNESMKISTHIIRLIVRLLRICIWV